VPPVVPGYESLNSNEPDAEWRIIPGARRFDYDERLCDPDAVLPHMMPSAALFEQEVRSLGLSKESLVVVYDDVGVYASPRGWWMLKAMGHDNVAVLDGGLRAWIDAGNATDLAGAEWRAGKQNSGDAYPQGDFVAAPRPEAFVDSAAVAEALSDPSCRVLDARSTARFNAQAPEPRPGVRGGHMPGSLSFPFPTVLSGQKMKSALELALLLSPHVQRDQRVITSCGSGLTACVVILGAALAGFSRLSVYDGSWADWGADNALPVVEGPNIG
jgi:thiosulfate/3-mercaptopyruvate sulfurtransferase